MLVVVMVHVVGVWTLSEVGGKGPQPGNRSVSCVRARGLCLVRSGQNVERGRFPFPLFGPAGFPFSLFGAPCFPFSLVSTSEIKETL